MSWEAAATIAAPIVSGLFDTFGGNRSESYQSSIPGFPEQVTQKNLENQDRNYKFQADLATHGIRWRVNDAKRAGLHPLVGAGIAPSQGSAAIPVGFDGRQRIRGGSSDLKKMGQSIARAISATATVEEKALFKIRLKQEEKKLENMGLVNARLRHENAQLTSPDMPSVDNLGVIDGQGDGKTGYPPGVIYEDVRLPKKRSVGTKAGSPPAEAQYGLDTLAGARSVGAPGQEFSEAAEVWAVQLQYGVMKGLDIASSLGAWLQPHGKWSKRNRNQLRRYRDTVLEKPRKGHFWAYDAPTGTWIMIKKGPDKMRLYKDRAWHHMYKYGME